MRTNPSILIIDDDPMLCELLALHLSFAGYDNVRVAEDAVVGGRMLLESPPDLLLTDIIMPYLDGLQLLEAMRGDDTTRNIPVIIISIRKDDEAYQKARQFGACAYLQKPLDAAELVATVKRVLADPTPM